MLRIIGLALLTIALSFAYSAAPAFADDPPPDCAEMEDLAQVWVEGGVITFQPSLYIEWDAGFSHNLTAFRYGHGLIAAVDNGGQSSADFKFNFGGGRARLITVSAEYNISHNESNTAAVRRSLGTSIPSTSNTGVNNPRYEWITGSGFNITASDYTQTSFGFQSSVGLASRNRYTEFRYLSFEYLWTEYPPEYQCIEDPLPEYVRPLRSGEYGIAGDYELTGTNATNPTLLAFSDATERLVHAAVDGTVTQIRTARLSDDCDRVFRDSSALPQPNSWQNCTVAESIYDGDKVGDVRIGVVTGLEVAQGPTNARMRAQVVTVVDDEGGTWRYWVWNAEKYVNTGYQIQAGCAVGETVRLESPSSNWSQFLANLAFNQRIDFSAFQTQYLAQGLAVVEMPAGESTESIARPNGFEPTLGSCQRPPEFEQCMADIDLSFRGSWRSENTDWRPSGGVMIQPGGWIENTLNLNMDRQPVIIISWVSAAVPDLSPNNRPPRLSIGGVEHIYTRQSQLAGNYITHQTDTIDISAAQADSSGFYTLRIDGNTHRGSTSIQYICITHRLDEDLLETWLPTPHCYFENHTFDAGLEGWGTESFAVLPPRPLGVEGGSVALPGGGIIRQNVRLLGDQTDPVDYTLTMDFAGQHLGGEPWLMEIHIRWGTYFTDNPLYYNADSEGWVEWNFMTTAIQRDNFGLSTIGYPLSVLASYEADLEIRFTFADDPDPLLVWAVVSRLCLDGDFPPDRPIAPFNETCTIVETPVDEDFRLWVIYHWRQLNRFFTCDLMVVLNALYEETEQGFTTMKWFFRWMMITLYTTMEWVSSDVLFWMNGHLSNIAGGTIVVVEGSSGGCDSVWCVLGSLFNGIAGIFDNIANVLVSAIDRVFGPIVEFLIAVLGTGFAFLIGLAQQFIDLLIYAARLLLDSAANLFGFLNRVIYDATTTEPIEIPVLPYCNTAPEANIFCRVSWVAENTFLRDHGALIMPLFAGYIAVMLILWIIGEVKRSILESGRML